MLALQLGIVFVVLLGVAGVSIAQSHVRDLETEGRRALSVAETLASTVSVRDALRDPNHPGLRVQAQIVAENGRSVSGSTYVLLAAPTRRLVLSTDPARLTSEPVLQDSPAFAGQSWVGTDAATGAAMAAVPVLSISTADGTLGQTLGVIAVGRDYPTALENLAAAVPNLLTYLGIASLLGVLGSLLLSRRVKRQTLGLEPLEIAGLVEHRDAMLHGIKEGVLALDLHGRVTLINDHAATLLGMSSVSTGRFLAEMVSSPHLLDVLTGPVAGMDRVVAVQGRLVTLNRMPIVSRGRRIGWVTTLRDRTELLELQRELDVTRETTDTLRAQAHEFSNRMHIVSGLIQLEEYDEVRSYVQRISADQTRLTTAVTSRVDDPAVAALLIAKSSLAAERGVALVVEESTRLGRIDEELSTDISTVLGNLVDNALDALDPSEGGEVHVQVTCDSAQVTVSVRDSGPGVSADAATRVFAHGFTTKAEDVNTKRGIGLALVRLICRRRGGEVTVRNDDGAVFSAVLPLTGGVEPT